MSASSKVTLGSVAGLLVGLLTMGGYVDPTHATDVTQWIEAIFGGAMALISLYSYLEHHIQQANKSSTPNIIVSGGTTTTTTTS